MSRLCEIIENHEQIEKLTALLKHHSVSAEYVTATLIQAFDGTEKQDDSSAELVTDLKQLYATY